MKLLWASAAWDDYVHWLTADPKIICAINDVVPDIRRDPFRGLGKPEPLKHRLQGWWSRRITREHRLIYRVSGSDPDRRVEIASCQHHYSRPECPPDTALPPCPRPW